MSSYFKVIIFYYFPAITLCNQLFHTSVYVTAIIPLYGIYCLRSIKYLRKLDFGYLILIFLITAGLIFRDILGGWLYYESPARLLQYLVIYFFIPITLLLFSSKMHLKRLMGLEKLVVFVLLPFLLYFLLTREYGSFFLRDSGSDRIISPSAFGLYIVYLFTFLYYSDRLYFNIVALPYAFLIFVSGTRTAMILFLLLCFVKFRKNVTFYGLLAIGLLNQSSLNLINSRAINFVSNKLTEEARYDVYLNTLKIIEQNWLFGIGWFLPNVDGYAHNIILELLHIGGAFWLAAWLLLAVVSLNFRIRRPVALILLLVPVMFSGAWHTSYYLVPMLALTSKLDFENSYYTK